MLFKVGNFSIDTLNYVIKESGNDIECEPKVFDLIVYLLKKHDRLVSREELFREIWQGREVSDTSLSNHIKSARKIFGDNGHKQSVIKTVHGRGYQFVAEVIQLDTHSKTNSKPVNFKLAFYCLCVVLLLFITSKYFPQLNDNEEIEKDYLIAVLPFSNSLPSKSTDYLGFAIADRVISEFAYQENISVRSSSSIRKYANPMVDQQIAGSELNVDYLLSGTYLKVDQSIRVNIELVKVETKELIWRSKQLEVTYENTFQLQDIVAKNVLEGLKLQWLDNSRRNRMANNSPDPNAYEYYLRSISQPFSSDGHRTAINLLKRSLAIDKNYAPTYVQLGNRIRRLEQFGLVNTGESHDTLNYYQEALRIDKNLLSALSYLSFIYTETNRIDEAMELVLRMLKINPKNAQTRFTLGYVLRYAGQSHRAIIEMERAVKLDPKNIRFRTLVSTYSGMGMFDKAKTQLQAYPDSSFTTGWNGILNLRTGNQQEALKYFEQLIELDSEGLWGLVATVHRAYILGEQKQGLLAVHKLEQTNIQDAETVYYTAAYYCMLGDNERCLQSLKKAVEGGYYNFHYIDNSPYWNDVNELPEFLEIYELAKKKSNAFKLEYLTSQYAEYFSE